MIGYCHTSFQREEFPHKCRQKDRAMKEVWEGSGPTEWRYDLAKGVSQCGHFQLHIRFWPLDHIRKLLIWLAIVIYKDFHIKCCYWSMMQKYKRFIEDFRSLKVIMHALSNLLTNEPKVVSIFWAHSLHLSYHMSFWYLFMVILN